MDSKKFGPYFWHTLFIIAMNYPVHIDMRNRKDRELRKHYKSYYESYIHMLPCGHCRQSYAIFLKEIPIEPYLGGRRDLVFWLYSIHDLVNKKLLVQKMEKKGYAVDICRVKTSPPFSEVYAYYNNNFRAKSKKTKRCK